MIIGLIAAVSDNGVVALDDGSLPWQMKSDLRHFRKVTEGCSLLVGRRTFDLLPRAMIDQGNRQFFVLSKSSAAWNFACRLSDPKQRERVQERLGQPGDGQRYLAPNVRVVRSVDDAVHHSSLLRRGALWCIGGPLAWDEAVGYAQKVELSRIHTRLDVGYHWYPMSVHGFESCEQPRPVPDLEQAGFHLTKIEHRPKVVGDDYDWSVEHWRRGH